MMFRNAFRLFVARNENVDQRDLLAGVLKEFPDPTSLLVLADALEEGGDAEFGQAIRYMVTSKDADAMQRARPYVEALRKKLSRSGVHIYHDEIEVPSGDRYEWHGKVVAKHSRSGSATRTIVDLASIEDMDAVRGLAVLAAHFYLASRHSTAGLEDMPRTKAGKLSREGKRLTAERQADQAESAVRQSIRPFLVGLADIEQVARTLAGSQRPRNDDRHHLQMMMSQGNLGYQLQLSLTEEVVRRFVEENGTTPFLQNIAARITAALRMAEGEVDCDRRMVDGMRRIAALINSRRPA